MQSQQIGEAGGERTHILIFQTGEEVMAGLLGFAKQSKLTAAHFTAIGAFRDVTLAYFDWQKKEYRQIPVGEQVEVLMFAGDIALKEGEPQVHAHVVIGKADGSAHGGHVIQAHVRPTLEVILNESPAHLQRRVDDRTGLALIDLHA